MGKGTNVHNGEINRTFSWAEIQKHASKDDRWIAVDGYVYDVTRFQKKHPGGARIMGHFAGQDATVRLEPSLEQACTHVCGHIYTGALRVLFSAQSAQSWVAMTSDV